MRRFLAAAFAIGMVAGCHPLNGPSSPASDGVRAYVAALRSKDPRAAYDMLAPDVKKKVKFDDFAVDWKKYEPEREWQAKELEESLKGSPDVGERAQIGFPDGKVVSLEREGKQWRLESELVTPSRAKTPRDAIREFSAAIEQRDIGRILAILSDRRRVGMQRQIEGFVNGVGKHAGDKMENQGDAKATLTWDDNNITYKIVLKKEDDEWRIDDVYVRPKNPDDGKDGADKPAEPIPEDF